MKKNELIKQLETAKVLSSTVDIDKVISLIKQIEIGGITEDLADDICRKIERVLDYNSSDLVDKDDITFSINYGNTIEIDDANINVYDTVEHVRTVLSEFVVEEEEEEVKEEDSTERTQFTVPVEE
jgi:hypothetical protein